MAIRCYLYPIPPAIFFDSPASSGGSGTLTFKKKKKKKGGMGIPSSLLLHSDLVSKIIRLFYDVSYCYDPHAIHVVHFDHLTSRVKVHKLDPL